MRTKLKSNSGMTLVETIVALLLFTVLATMVSTIMIPVLNTYMRANDLAELTVLVENIGSEIVDDLKQSTALAEITGGNAIKVKIESNTVEYKIDEGVLKKKFTTNDPSFDVDSHGAEFYPVFHEKYYRGKKLNIAYSVSGGEKPIYKVEITITNKDGLTRVVGNTFTAKPLVLNQFNTTTPTTP